jgi:hypothetical protein
MLRRIKELETQVAQLQQKNVNLRRQALDFASSSVPSRAQSETPQLLGGETVMAYMISCTSKPHNSGCRFFGVGCFADPLLTV